MAAFWYTPAKQKLAKGDLDFDTVDLRVKLVMTNTTTDTEQDAANLAAFTTIDEYDGSGYTAIDLAGISVNEDDANNRSEIDYSDGSFGATVGAGTRNWQALLYYVRVDGTNANDYPVAYIDVTAANGNGGAVNLTVNAEGLLQIT
jgi:hypothetical protein